MLIEHAIHAIVAKTGRAVKTFYRKALCMLLYVIYIYFFKLNNLSRDKVRCKYCQLTCQQCPIHTVPDAGHELLLSTPFTMYYRHTIILKR